MLLSSIFTQNISYDMTECHIICDELYNGDSPSIQRGGSVQCLGVIEPPSYMNDSEHYAVT